MGTAFEYSYSIDFIKNPVLLAKWNAYKRRSTPGDLEDFCEIERKGRNRIHKLYFRTAELERAAMEYFGAEEIEEETILLVEGINIA